MTMKKLPEGYWLDLPHKCGLDSLADLVILSHGAGTPADHEWMNAVVALLNQQSIGVVRFEFPYMRHRRLTGQRRLPDKQPVLEQAWLDAIVQVRKHYSGRLWLAGKSLGGRIASMILERADAVGGICFGYPFHPPKKTDHLRTKHLQTLAKPLLIIQGTRDPFGTQEEVTGYSLSQSIDLQWLVDGDHDFKPRKRSGYERADHLLTVAKWVREFIEKQSVE